MIAERPSSPEERAAYRRWVREHHPDVGGDPDEFIAGLARRQADASRAGRVSSGRSAPEDRYDAPVEFVPNHQRLRAGLHRIWRRFRRTDPPRVV